MWDIPKLYLSSCSNSVQLVPMHPIVMSILFHHYEELKECISEVKQMKAAEATTTNTTAVNNNREKKKEELTRKGVEKEKEANLSVASPTTSAARRQLRLSEF